MLDPSFVRDNLDAVQKGMANRGLNVTTELQQLATAETHRRRLIPQIEGLKREQNSSGDEVARAKRQGKDAAHLFEAAASAAGRWPGSGSAPAGELARSSSAAARMPRI